MLRTPEQAGALGEVGAEALYRGWPGFAAIDGWTREGLFQTTLGRRHALKGTSEELEAVVRGVQQHTEGGGAPPVYIVTLKGHNTTEYRTWQATCAALRDSKQYVLELDVDDVKAWLKRQA